MLFFIITRVALTAGQQCLGLALEAGGSKGAYEAGVLSVLTDPSNNLNVNYDIITGVSIGSLTSCTIAQFPKGQEWQMSQYLTQVWFNIKGNSDIYVEWPGGLITGILFESGLYNDAPAIKYFGSYFKSPQRNVTVGATNLDLGVFQNFNESIGNDLFQACVASASVPLMFPPHVFNGYPWIDGGVVYGIDIPSAIERCLEKVDESQVAIDVILDYYNAPLPNETSFKTPEVFERVAEIAKYDEFLKYLYLAQVAYPEVDFRYLIKPSAQMGYSLNFSQTNIQYNYNLGVKDGNSAFRSTRKGKDVIFELYEDNKEIRHI